MMSNSKIKLRPWINLVWKPLYKQIVFGVPQNSQSFLTVGTHHAASLFPGHGNVCCSNCWKHAPPPSMPHISAQTTLPWASLPCPLPVSSLAVEASEFLCRKGLGTTIYVEMGIEVLSETCICIVSILHLSWRPCRGLLEIVEALRISIPLCMSRWLPKLVR